MGAGQVASRPGSPTQPDGRADTTRPARVAAASAPCIASDAELGQLCNRGGPDACQVIGVNVSPIDGGEVCGRLWPKRSTCQATSAGMLQQVGAEQPRAPEVCGTVRADTAAAHSQCSANGPCVGCPPVIKFRAPDTSARRRSASATSDRARFPLGVADAPSPLIFPHNMAQLSLGVGSVTEPRAGSAGRANRATTLGNLPGADHDEPALIRRSNGAGETFRECFDGHSTRTRRTNPPTPRQL